MLYLQPGKRIPGPSSEDATLRLRPSSLEPGSPAVQSQPGSGGNRALHKRGPQGGTAKVFPVQISPLWGAGIDGKCSTAPHQYFSTWPALRGPDFKPGGWGIWGADITHLQTVKVEKYCSVHFSTIWAKPERLPR